MQHEGAIIVRVERQPTPELTVGDVLLSAFSLTGALVLLSLVLAGLFAMLLVRYHRRRPIELDRPPSIVESGPPAAASLE